MDTPIYDRTCAAMGWSPEDLQPFDLDDFLLTSRARATARVWLLADARKDRAEQQRRQSWRKTPSRRR